MMNLTFLLLLLAATSDGPAKTGQESCPMHEQHMRGVTKEHGEAVDSRHDTFGMSHETTRHNFRMFGDGGAIELRSVGNDPATVAAIRSHLREIEVEFRRGDFEKPRFVHGALPPAVARMKASADAIDYRYEELHGGARIRITTATAEATAAIHDFIRFQVIEHRTGDTGAVEDDTPPADRSRADG